MRKLIILLITLLIWQGSFAQTKFDEYEKLISDDEGSRFYAVSREYLKNKDSKVYILINKEQKMPLGRFLRYFYGVESWLKLLNIKEDSIVMIPGEEKERQSTQIWFVRENENPPNLTKMSLEEKLKNGIKKEILFDQECIDCDLSPFIKQYIFREGIDYLSATLKSNPNTIAKLKISKVEFLSKISERKELEEQIFTRFKKNGILRERISIQFTKGNSARFYIIPKTVKIKKN